MSADNEYIDPIDELLEQSQALGEGPAQVAVLLEAVNLADRLGDADLAFQVRMELINAAMSAGKSEVMLVAFSWCLAQCDRSPATFSEEPLLWKYRWIVFSLPLFPEVRRDPLLAALDAMTAGFRKSGSTLRAVHLLRSNVALRMGDRRLAAEAHEAWRKSPRDRLSDSPEIEQDFRVDFLVFAGEVEEALRQAKPLLSGRMRRRYEPNSTYPELLLPLLRLRRVEQALDFHRHGYQLLSGKPHEHHLTEYADHLTFLALTDNWSRAANIVGKVLPAALNTVSIGLRFDFYLAARLFLHRLAERFPQPLALHLPSRFCSVRAIGPLCAEATGRGVRHRIDRPGPFLRCPQRQRLLPAADRRSGDAEEVGLPLPVDGKGAAHRVSGSSPRVFNACGSDDRVVILYVILRRGSTRPVPAGKDPMNMRGVILAGGKGTRLGELTRVTNKHLLPVGPYPMVYHPLKKMVGAGLREILLVSGTEHMGDFVRTAVGSGRERSCQLTYRGSG